ncbi:hypothetical protein AURDEDRAFT_188807 [Auricularia subglabra TFB-10046 SS5]|uniref:Mitochondrial chaperone BCS1-like ATPase lid domain-containing protein n=1 Tax=Auricularia subglabra (strain TFB-10046 / SS5) TaxID=717982 RepID=J0CX52_AURST|nr:hypothetical protein AURDEDRAFT_188807 [Auricularia subglabra TFB-10046 SS5]
MCTPGSPARPAECASGSQNGHRRSPSTIVSLSASVRGRCSFLSASDSPALLPRVLLEARFSCRHTERDKVAGRAALPQLLPDGQPAVVLDVVRQLRSRCGVHPRGGRGAGARGCERAALTAMPLGADGCPAPSTMMGTPAGGFVSASYPPSPPSSASPVVPPSPSRSARSQPLTEEEARHRMKAFGAAYPPPPPPMLDYPAVPALDAQRLAELAAMFAAAIPDDEFSVAALQGYLLKNKSRPEAAAYEAAGWVQTERELRERLAREKEAKERREREEAQERREGERKAEECEWQQHEDEERRPEREEKERKEKEEKDETAATTPTAAAPEPEPEPAAAPAPAPAPAAAPEPAPAPAPVAAADVISVARKPAPGDADKNVWLRVMNKHRRHRPCSRARPLPSSTSATTPGHRFVLAALVRRTRLAICFS